MRQTHIPGPVTRALTLVLCIQVSWAGPQLEQRAGKRGIKAFIHKSIVFIDIN